MDDFAYDTTGTAPDAETVVLLPGINCGAWFWEEAIPHFLPDYRLVRFNNPGVAGTSTKGIRSVKDIARRVLDILDNLGVGTVHVVGHSMGGFVAQELVLMAPNRVDRLVLIGTSYGQPQMSRDLIALPRAIGISWDKFNRETLRDPHKVLRVLFGRRFRQEHLDKYDIFIQKRDAAFPGKEASALMLGVSGVFSGAGRIHHIETPSLVIHGEEDPLVSLEAGRKLAGQLRQARLWTLPGVRHFPTLEQENIFPRIIDFLKGNQVGEAVSPDKPLAFPLKETIEEALAVAKDFWER
jgi:pimeloyl-ACP methyl ester carboxylesterase